MNIGFAFTGSFCTHRQALGVLERLISKNYNIVPIFSPSVNETDTRFGTAGELRDKAIALCGRDVITTIKDAEPLGPKNLIDALVIVPTTGNTIAKLALGITDTCVTMAAKSLSRNGKPVILGISTNDGLGGSLKNIATLYNYSNYFFVPFRQDDCIIKPKSLVCDFERTEATLNEALNGKQIQPVLIN